MFPNPISNMKATLFSVSHIGIGMRIVEIRYIWTLSLVKVVLSLINELYLYIHVYYFGCCVNALCIKNNELLQIFTELCHSKML